LKDLDICRSDLEEYKQTLQKMYQLYN